jgi:hypothetical protein
MTEASFGFLIQFKTTSIPNLPRMKTFLLSLFTLAPFIFCLSQGLTPPTHKVLPKNHVSLNVSQLALQEFRVGYERNMGKRHSLELELAYKPDMGDSGINNYIGSVPYLAGSSYSAFLGYKFFLTKRPYPRIRPYLEPKLLARYTEYQDKMYTNHDTRSSYPSHLESGYDKIYGGFFLAGSRFYMGRSRVLFFDVYAGLSLRVKYLSTQVSGACSYRFQGSTCNYEHLKSIQDESQPYDHTIDLQVAPQAGLKFGVAF